jgi:hypothetical protein
MILCCSIETLQKQFYVKTDDNSRYNLQKWVYPNSCFDGNRYHVPFKKKRLWIFACKKITNFEILLHTWIRKYLFIIIMTLIAMKDIYVPKNWYIYRWCIYLLGDCMELLLNHIKYYCFTTNFMYYWKFSYPVGHLVFESFIFKLSTRIILLVKRLCSDLVIYMLLITLVGVEKEGS